MAVGVYSVVPNQEARMDKVTLTAEEIAEMDEQDAVAQVLFDRLFSDTPDGVDVSGVAHAMWTWIIQFLAECGWTADELIGEVHRHVALGTTEGGMN